MGNKREVWVDYIKVIACILVVLGHFFQSMVKSGVLPRNNLFNWFNTSIYYFHVPLFFICSGYLYQRYGCVKNFQGWKNNIMKKGLVLGVPYIVFSYITWIIKSLFSGSVNEKIGGLADTLFVHPTSPYWYLYILFFIFLITPTINTKIMQYVIVCISIVFKMVYILAKIKIDSIYLISELFDNEIWFVLGMLIAIYGAERIKNRITGMILEIAFLFLSTFTYTSENLLVEFCMGVVACCSILMLLANCKERKVFSQMAQYTMPVFLMHTMFAAPVRTLLFRFGIDNPYLHIVCGLLISFIGPIIAIKALQMIKLDFIVYPEKLMRSRVNNA